MKNQFLSVLLAIVFIWKLCGCQINYFGDFIRIAKVLIWSFLWSWIFICPLYYKDLGFVLKIGNENWFNFHLCTFNFPTSSLRYANSFDEISFFQVIIGWQCYWMLCHCIIMIYILLDPSHLQPVSINLIFYDSQSFLLLLYHVPSLDINFGQKRLDMLL